MEKRLVSADMAQIEQLIEHKREEMHEASDRYGMLSGRVLKISQELDVLLNKYQQISALLCKRQ
ncbi:aspartyl-phosphate phosphatase Spo0E family protein [Paenibacillus ihuae]|uniref:aspartyl-phosphate phosphatase Spo0E family protein n=1 Tax=Paenibacillus ihuae TaxID=1232431 RepID=UPI001FD7DEAC|nr:aspartyl-phosphate phosphatase Spo0E family protein [Paenibacillus ihuae]